MTDNLLQCPFCGGEAEHRPELGLRSPGYWVRCMVCKVQSDDRNSPEGAASRWNTRHSPAVQLEQGPVAKQWRLPGSKSWQMGRVPDWADGEVEERNLYAKPVAVADVRGKVIEDVKQIIEPWTSVATMKLRAGEMTANESRTVQAVLNSILASIRALQQQAGR